jgi:hypothetical protein
MTTMTTAPSRRTSVLQALGITPWVLRAPVAGEQAVAPEGVAVPASSAACVVVLPAGADPRALDLLGRALNACGAGLARAGRISVSDGRPSAAVPHAPVYLVLGQAQAHALGRELPAAVMSQAHIAMADEPSTLLADAGSKRRLWTALRQVRRALAVSRDR